MKIANIFNEVVSLGMCIGCGACTVVCPHKLLNVSWCHNKGLPQAGYKADATCCEEKCGRCLRVCSFHPETKQTDVIANNLFTSHAEINNHPEVGYWFENFVGYAPEEKIRTGAASGGLVTYLLQSLMSAGLITAAACVERNPNPEMASVPLFAYRICHDTEAIATCSRSAYYPVGMDAVLQEIIATPGRYAFVVLPCMAKALRLACEINSTLKERVVFVLGLVCGQVKTAHFAEFLAAKCGFSNIREIDFRVKAPAYPNSNFGVRIVEEGGSKQLLNFGDFSRCWSNRYFTPLSCNQCTDVFAETADAAFMDAWTPGLQEDWRGWSYVTVRNPELLAHFKGFAAEFPANLQSVDIAAVIKSQEAVLVSKREDVYWRGIKAVKNGTPKLRPNPKQLRKPRIVRRWMSEFSYCIAQASNENWPKYRFRTNRFLASMFPSRLGMELGRTVWRISRIIDLFKMKGRSLYDK